MDHGRAEPDIIASVSQIADIGFRLNIILDTFEKVPASTDKFVISISKDVSLISSMLKELGEVLGRDQAEDSKLLSKTAIETADDVVRECLEVFQEMEFVLVKEMPILPTPGVERTSPGTALLERLRWPYVQPKLHLLHSDLDRLRSTISLMLNVIDYACQHSSKTENAYTIADQKSLIEDLAQSNQDCIQRFKDIELGMEVRGLLDTMDQMYQVLGKASEGLGKKVSQQDVNLLSISVDDLRHPEFLNAVVLSNLLEMHAQSESGSQFQRLTVYLTAMLNEIDDIEFLIEPPSRSGVKVALHDTLDQKMHYLVNPLRKNWLMLAKKPFCISYGSFWGQVEPLFKAFWGSRSFLLMREFATGWKS